ncbi:CoA transferase [Sphingomonas sp. G-3-2-10]|uniref:CoA transferase n=1 Tax=Sphingomonas sp. G-3-2-10 TaxID=2728838 RepID=UPI00146D9BFD|nr:CoA transferase [Sphingomonas sp. G-3-2-10]NML04348.1 carnitine dehydratase [Sphingomonas sp. G-3-2-10]
MMLSHIRVVDLTRDLGAYAGALLARLGAEVVTTGTSERDAAELAMDQHGKVTSDTPLLDLIDAADIVFRGPEACPPELSPEALAMRNPKLIDVAILPFDAGRANDGRPATDLTLMARSGLMTIVGDPGRPPLTLPGRQAWALAGIQGAIAALTALHARAADGLGQQAQVSAYRSAVLANYREPLTWEWNGKVGTRTGNLLIRGKSGVRQVWRAKDGWVTWALVDNQPMMRATVARMAEDGMAGELAEVDWDAILVADMPQEILQRWESVVEAWLATKDRATLTILSNKHGMGLSAISEVEDVLASDHLAARGLWEEATVAGKTVKIPGPLFREVGP